MQIMAVICGVENEWGDKGTKEIVEEMMSEAILFFDPKKVRINEYVPDDDLFPIVMFLSDFDLNENKMKKLWDAGGFDLARGIYKDKNFNSLISNIRKSLKRVEE